MGTLILGVGDTELVGTQGSAPASFLFAFSPSPLRRHLHLLRRLHCGHSAALRLLHQARGLHGGQGPHQHQPHPLPRRLCRVHPAQGPGEAAGGSWEAGGHVTAGCRTSPEHPPLCSQDAQPHSGLLQASLITLYTIYVTWSALANVPSKQDAALGSGLGCTGQDHTLGWVLCPPWVSGGMC